MVGISYIVKHKDIDVRMASRSGGIFTALSDIVIDYGGLIYGCSLDKDYSAIHKRIEGKEERNMFRQSKYIQSDLKNVFQSVKTDLLNKKTVLFSGTSCQVDGLKKYCAHVDTDQLYCVDIVCHGVPSPYIWKAYLDYMSRKYHGVIQAVDFRNKRKYGWAEHIETLNIAGNNYDRTIFTKLFYKHDILRPSCYQCPYKDILHPGDITIADAWGVEVSDADFNDNKGVSLTLVNSEKGLGLFKKALPDCEFREVNLKNYMQQPLRKPFPKPAERDKFWSDYKSLIFAKIIHMYTNDPLYKKIGSKLKKIVKKFMQSKIKSDHGDSYVKG